ncbi:hypothetical protein MNBD_GAMMA12-1042 [hydrothermal vent metagenome]|uniref:Uncharacterized protein n=1 Tax=hydrothermal vent metagenome TaxID=652676 RepID=A0A3B0Z3W2_9ZZZZ
MLLAKVLFNFRIKLLTVYLNEQNCFGILSLFYRKYSKL